MQARDRVNDDGMINFWRAYLVRAIRDLDEGFYRKAAEVFILDDDERVLGFRWACEALGFDADALRKKVMDPRVRRRLYHGNRMLKRAA